MNQTASLLATLALLAAPGPTNALLALAGAQQGPRQAIRLVPLVAATYLATILPLAALGAGLFARWPGAGGAIRFAAALWLLALARSLWRADPPGAAPRGITARQALLTTLLNPKALVIAFVLLPPPGHARFAPALGAVALSIVLAATGWALAGTLARPGRAQGRGAAPTLALRRLASGWFALIATGLLASLAPVATLA